MVVGVPVHGLALIIFEAGYTEIKTGLSKCLLFSNFLVNRGIEMLECMYKERSRKSLTLSLI